MKILLFISAAVLVATPALARQEVTLRQQCYGNRCVFYTPDGRRVGSLTDYGYGRQAVRNNSGARVGTVIQRGNRVTIRKTFP